MRESISPCLLLAESWNSFLQHPHQTSYVPQTKLLIFLHPHAVTKLGFWLSSLQSLPHRQLPPCSAQSATKSCEIYTNSIPLPGAWGRPSTPPKSPSASDHPDQNRNGQANLLQPAMTPPQTLPSGIGVDKSEKCVNACMKFKNPL